MKFIVVKKAASTTVANKMVLLRILVLLLTSTSHQEIARGATYQVHHAPTLRKRIGSLKNSILLAQPFHNNKMLSMPRIVKISFAGNSVSVLEWIPRRKVIYQKNCGNRQPQNYMSKKLIATQ